MWQNIRCSILGHLLVPGGKWHTEIPRLILRAICYVAHNERDIPSEEYIYV